MKRWVIALLVHVALSDVGCASAGDAAPPGVDPNDGAEERAAFAQAFVDAHNDARAAATPPPPAPLPPMQWKDELAAFATDWALGCVFEHSGGPYGENLALFSAPSTTPADVVEAWASEVADYDYARKRCAPGAQCGHYTQVVWRDSTGVGCGVAACDGVIGFGAGMLFVCSYDPPGNFIGQQPY
jgi:uncharacterized protein YkwD